jgi:hypothetical protein
MADDRGSIGHRAGSHDDDRQRDIPLRELGGLA